MGRRWILTMVWVVVWGHASCTSPNPDYEDSQASHNDGAATADADEQACNAGEFLGCDTETKLRKCSEDGLGTQVIDCRPGRCDVDLERCTQCDPAMDPRCDGDLLVSCTAQGQLVKTQCPDGCSGGSCVGCTTEIAFYRDDDHDGFGNPDSLRRACAAPQGYVTNGSDCDDVDPQAHPGQTSYFEEPTAGSGDFDFDCNGKEEPRDPLLESCQPDGRTCDGSGWSGTVPACGEEGVYVKCVKGSGAQRECKQVPDVKTQACR